MHLRTKLLPYVLFLLVLGVSLGCSSKSDYHKTLRAQTLQASARMPMMLAAYQPWFGREGHINVGYSSQDRTVLERQIGEAKKLGVGAFVVNWYGKQHQFEDSSYALLQQIANSDPDGFKVSLMYDENDSDAADSTGAVLDDLNYAYDRYISAKAQVPNDSYLRFNGRPVIFIFPKGTSTDWNRVRQAVDQWQDKPLLIYKDPNEKWASAFDGFYAWVAPGKLGWQHDGSNWGEEYLEDFYTRMNKQFPDKIAVGGAWPGFDDTKASWSRNRKMSARCGRTLEDSLKLFRRYYDSSRPLPFMMIETWNDYEEGTNIEGAKRGC